MPKLPDLDRCTGCTACAAVCPKNCITMAADRDGFLHPAADESLCVRCGLCEAVCPVLDVPHPDHVPDAFAVRSRDDAARRASTSGGVFTELARDILARGGAVFGAAYDEDFRVLHICVETESELFRLRGAKYAQSDLLSSFRAVKQRLEQGQTVLFSGTPCQVLGLTRFLRRDYENLILVDLVCHSVPSPLAWQRYLEYIRGTRRLAAVNLRAKDTGWSRYRYSNRFDFTDGSCRLDPSADSLYMKLFGGGYITRPSCADCPAKGHARVSDLTLGDFWGIWDLDPDFDDDGGVSLVLVQSRKGRELMDRIGDSLLCRAVSLADACAENPAILRSALPSPEQAKAMELIRAGRMDQCRGFFAAPRRSLLTRCLGRIRRMLPWS